MKPRVPSPASPPTGTSILELLHPGQHGQVLLVAQLLVVAARMPRVEGVEPHDVEGLGQEEPHPTLQAGLGWAALGWTGLGWARLGWAGVTWARLGQAGLDWARLGGVLGLVPPPHLPPVGGRIC